MLRTYRAKMFPAFFFIIFVTLSGCATQYDSDISFGDISRSFTTGASRLDCEISCAGTYGWNQDNLKELYLLKNWKDLALQVIKIGDDSDQAYFYLAISAENLGYPKAATIYYRLASASSYPCDSASMCDNIDVPREIKLGLRRLEARKVAIRSTGKTLEPEKKLVIDIENENLRKTFSQMSFEERQVVQIELAKLGYYSSAIDGIFGPSMRTASFRFNTDFKDSADLTQPRNVRDLFFTLVDMNRKQAARKAKSAPSNILEPMQPIQ